MHRHAISSEHFRHAVIWKPSFIFNTGRCKFFERLGGITHTVYARFQSQPLHGPDEKLANLFRAFIVAPIADPHDIAPLFQGGMRIERPYIRRFVPRPRIASPSSLE